MKKVSIILSFVAVFMLGATSVSCSSQGDNKTTETKTEVKATEDVEKTTTNTAGYICPMKCEGDKVYAAPGACPVCKMDMVETKS